MTAGCRQRDERGRKYNSKTFESNSDLHLFFLGGGNFVPAASVHAILRLQEKGYHQFPCETIIRLLILSDSCFHLVGTNCRRGYAHKLPYLPRRGGAVSATGWFSLFFFVLFSCNFVVSLLPVGALLASVTAKMARAVLPAFRGK
jgi:hypothetical protein